MRADVRIKLQERQQALRDKNAGIAPRPPLAFAAQIDPLIRKLLDRPGLQKEVSDALSQSLPTVIQYLGTIVTAETSSSEDRLAASNNLFWIYGISQKYSAMLQRLDTRKTVEQKKRALWEARRASALAKKEGAILEVEKQKRKHARKLTKALADVAKMGEKANGNN